MRVNKHREQIAEILVPSADGGAPAKMPPKRKAVKETDVQQSDDPPTTRSSTRCVLYYFPLLSPFWDSEKLSLSLKCAAFSFLSIDHSSSCHRIRNKQLQAAAKPVRDAGHLETRAMSSAPKQNAARKRGPWGEDYLMTSTKSALVHADLVVCPFLPGL